jgi:hypothetical protein
LANINSPVAEAVYVHFLCAELFAAGHFSAFDELSLLISIGELPQKLIFLQSF